MKIKRIFFAVSIITFIMILMCGCKNERKDYLDKKIARLVVDYKKEEGQCCVRIDFTKKSRSASLYLTEVKKSEDTYMYADDMEQMLRDKVLKDDQLIEKKNKSNNNSTDEQAVLWRIRVYFEDGEWVQLESLSNNPYTPDYWDDFIALLEK